MLAGLIHRGFDVARGPTIVGLLALGVSLAHAGETGGSTDQAWRIDTEHLFGFVIGTDVGEVGDKEMEAEVVGDLGKRPGPYTALFPSLEYEFVPISNLRLAPTVLTAYHSISGVADLDDRRQFAFDGVSFDARYRLLDRSQWGLGLTLNAEPHLGFVDETSGQWVNSYGADFALALDRELVPDRVVAALNLLYQPETSRLHATGAWARDATAGIGAGIMTQVAPGILIGAEGRYLRKYEAIGLDNFAGQGLFVGPTLYARLSRRLWMIAAWSTQAAGRAVSSPGALDLTNFARHQAKIQFGLEF
jgi:hypothetical protein